MRKITDPSFRYVPALRTDLRKTFARVRKEQAAAKQSNVLPLKERVKS